MATAACTCDAVSNNYVWGRKGSEVVTAKAYHNHPLSLAMVVATDHSLSPHYLAPRLSETMRRLKLHTNTVVHLHICAMVW